MKALLIVLTLNLNSSVGVSVTRMENMEECEIARAQLSLLLPDVQAVFALSCKPLDPKVLELYKELERKKKLEELIPQKGRRSS